MFEIAHQLGRTVSELEETMGPHEFIEWIAYHTLKANPPKDEPFYSPDPKVQADQFRALLGAGGAPKK